MKTILKTALIVLSTSVATMAMMPEMNSEQDRDNTLGLTQLRAFAQVVSNPANNFQEMTHIVQQLQNQQDARQKLLSVFFEVQAPVGLPSGNPAIPVSLMQQTIQQDYDYVQGLLGQVYMTFPILNPAPMGMPGMPAPMMPGAMFPPVAMPGMPAPMGMPVMPAPMDNLDPAQRNLVNLFRTATEISGTVSNGTGITVTFNPMGESSISINKGAH